MAVAPGSCPFPRRTLRFPPEAVAARTANRVLTFLHDSQIDSANARSSQLPPAAKTTVDGEFA
jgi:hypothetical protein